MNGGVMLLQVRHTFCFAAIAFSSAFAGAAEQTVYLLGGQSNMLGRAPKSGLPTSPVNLRGSQSDVTFYFRDPGSSGPNYNALVSLAPLTSNGSTFGPEVTFGRAIKDANPGKNITLIKYAHGDTSLYSDWKPQTGPDYAAFKSTVAAGLAAITARGDTYKIAGMLWLQGEADQGGAPAAYGTNITNFIADMRANYGATMPFVMAGTGYSNSGYTAVNSAMASIADTLPNTVYFSNYDLLGPSHTALHFDSADQQVIGQRYAEAFASIPEPGFVCVGGVLGMVQLLRRRRMPAVLGG